MAKSKRRNNRNKVEYLETALQNNGAAIQEGPRKKRWTEHDLTHIAPITPAQEDLFDYWDQGYDIVAYGSAGTGKTYQALYLALQEVIVNKEQQKIILVRSAVPTREVGFLPGTLEDKTALYELPYHDILHDLVGKRSSYSDMKEAGVIEFMTTSFIRGLTWDNAVIIVEEGENMTFHEIDSIMTRVGNNSRVIFTGDIKQTDLDGSKRNGECGMGQFLEVVKNMKFFESVEFRAQDIVRSDFVKSWILAQDDTTSY